MPSYIFILSIHLIFLKDCEEVTRSYTRVITHSSLIVITDQYSSFFIFSFLFLLGNRSPGEDGDTRASVCLCLRACMHACVNRNFASRNRRSLGHDEVGTAISTFAIKRVAIGAAGQCLAPWKCLVRVSGDWLTSTMNHHGRCPRFAQIVKEARRICARCLEGAR